MFSLLKKLEPKIGKPLISNDFSFKLSWSVFLPKIVVKLDVSNNSSLLSPSETSKLLILFSNSLISSSLTP